MSIAVTCPTCGQRFSAPPNLFGKRVRCPACQGSLDIPLAEPAPAFDPLGPSSPAAFPSAPQAPMYSPPSPQPVAQKKSTRKQWVIGISLGVVGVLLLSCLVCVGVLAGPIKSVMQRFDSTTQESQTLNEARQGFVTKIDRPESAQQPLPSPPPEVARIVKYRSPIGELGAYLTLPPASGGRHPAIIWITGGDCSTIDDGLFQDQPADNDQTASTFRRAGVVTMYPSLRGGNQNPGVHESFFGEVDDVLAAADFLAQQDFVDPQRIYLGGHSTGGTLVLLVAECSNRFRAVFSFGPVDNIMGYGYEFLPFDQGNVRELQLRNPGRWLNGIRSPVFVLEGADEPGNIGSLQKMAKATNNPQVHFIPVSNANHFDVLQPITKMIAQKILQDTGATTNLSLPSSLSLPLP